MELIHEYTITFYKEKEIKFNLSPYFPLKLNLLGAIQFIKSIT